MTSCLEVICGPMYSGKTEELIRRIKRVQIAKIPIQVFKPTIDTRYSKTNVVSHNSKSIEAIPVFSASEILSNIFLNTRVVAIDEAQFFKEDIIPTINMLIKEGRRVIVAGLDLDYMAKPFGQMPILLAIADTITKLTAICTVCGKEANRTQRTTEAQELIIVGAADSYEARCRYCHEF